MLRPRAILGMLVFVSLVAGGGATARAQGRFDRAQAAAILGRPAEVVALLEGHAVGARELTLLIEAYRAQGDTGHACAHIATLVERHGSWPQAATYRSLRATLCPAHAPEPGREPEPAPAERTAWRDARAAMERGDTRGVIIALEGRTRSARELALLIEAYRQAGNTRAACRTMDLFVRRYATAPQAVSYHQTISRTCNR